MAYHRCITGNNLGGGMKKTLLWTNPNFTVDFGATTLDLGLTNYDFVQIDTKITKALNYEEGKIVERVDMLNYGSISNSDPRNQTSASSRRYKISGDNILFTTGFAVTGNAQASVCIPIRIYGIKGKITE